MGTKQKQVCPGIGSVLHQVLLISNVIHDAGRVRSELHAYQRTAYSKIKAITSHSPTRWGAIIFIAKDLMKTKVRCILHAQFAADAFPSMRSAIWQGAAAKSKPFSPLSHRQL